ncbi:uncharacterized protein LOC123661647 [Melitaea cinxia]|uniref:uncharacterized protein LOC123661647 n=1 Tax=Melitaea cinxia TaxID=113334 RepID=UPI001E27451B|nr:uncharacterized protein LOC123661647 [Melitaea cinxia]
MEFACCVKSACEYNDPLKCTFCERNFHIACALPSKSPNWGPDDNTRLSWQCPSCVGSSPRNNDDDTPCRYVTKRPKQKLEKSIANVTNKIAITEPNLSIAQVTIEQIRAIIKSELEVAFSSFQKNFDELRAEISTLRGSMQFLSDKYDHVTKRIESVEAKIKPLQAVKSDCLDLQSVVTSLQVEINKKEQWARRSNIEIVGVPETKNENLLNVISNISKVVDINTYAEADIDFVTRVSPKNNDSKKPRPIVIRFLCRYKKDDFLARLREKKNIICSDIGFVGNSNRIYFNDHLTSSNKMLLRKTKELARDKNYRYVWIKNCSIMARKNDTSSVLHIQTEKDLKKM